MKVLFRIPILAIAFLIVLPSKSQDYIPMAVEGAHWVVAYNHIDTPWLVDDLWEYYAEGDTTIDGESYIKVYTRDLVITQDPPPFEPIGDYELKGFLRDDSIQRKVYAIDVDSWNDFCPSNEEFLMYDFSIQPEDTVGFCLVPDFYSCTLDSIYNGTYFGFDTRFYEFNTGEGVYEGLGSSYGLFDPMFTPLKKTNHIYISYTYLYYYCRESPCDLIVSVPEIHTKANYIELNPNPTRDIINIRLSPKGHKGEIRILNAYGQLIGKLMTTPGIEHYQFDMSAFPPGTYILVYTNGREVIARQKFVVVK